MAIKKAYQALYDFLEENQNSKVKTLLPAIEDMCSAKSGGAGGEAAYLKNEAGEVTHVKCYYHGTWEPVNPDGSAGEGVCEYGKKSTTPTGLNTMCKEGVSAWTKQQREAKNAQEKLLVDVMNGDVAPENIMTEREAIEAKRKEVVARKDGLGTADKPA